MSEAFLPGAALQAQLRFESELLQDDQLPEPDYSADLLSGLLEQVGVLSPASFEEQDEFERALLDDAQLPEPTPAAGLLDAVLERAGITNDLLAFIPVSPTRLAAAVDDDEPEYELPDPVRLPNSDTTYIIRYVNDYGDLLVFIIADSDGFIPRCRFRVEMQFHSAAPISGIVVYPDDVEQGANLGPLGSRRLTDVSGVALFRVE